MLLGFLALRTPTTSQRTDQLTRDEKKRGELSPCSVMNNSWNGELYDLFVIFHTFAIVELVVGKAA